MSFFPNLGAILSLMRSSIGIVWNTIMSYCPYWGPILSILRFSVGTVHTMYKYTSLDCWTSMKPINPILGIFFKEYYIVWTLGGKIWFYYNTEGVPSGVPRKSVVGYWGHPLVSSLSVKGNPYYSYSYPNNNILFYIEDIPWGTPQYHTYVLNISFYLI